MGSLNMVTTQTRVADCQQVDSGGSPYQSSSYSASFCRACSEYTTVIILEEHSVRVQKIMHHDSEYLIILAN